jgi:predicted phosphate transport protein (TIGR00153 family)
MIANISDRIICAHSSAKKIGGEAMALFGRKDKNLFFLFSESSRVVVRGGDILNDVIADYHDLDVKMSKMLELENEGDHIIEQLIARLNASFIMPFDREDAFQLAQKLATTLDYITGIIDRMILYKAGEPDQRVKEMVAVLYGALLLQQKAFKLIDKLEHNKKPIFECVEEIRQLERKQDDLYRSGLAALFENENEPLNIIKWREVYEHIEMATDHIEGVGNLIRNICVKYS